MSDLGKQTENGFLPNVPNIQDVMKKLGMGGGWDGVNEAGPATQEIADARKKVKEDLLSCYVKTFATPAGQRVLEDLLDQSLRRGMKPPGGFKSIEETALYTAERTGQNGFMAYVCSMIVKGKSLPDPAVKKKNSKKK